MRLDLPPGRYTYTVERGPEYRGVSYRWVVTPLAPSGFDADRRGLTIPDENAGGGSRTHTGVAPQRILSPQDDLPKFNGGRGLRIDDAPLAHHLPTDTRQTGPDLAEVVEAWDRLPEPTRQATLKLVREGRPG